MSDKQDYYGLVNRLLTYLYDTSYEELIADLVDAIEDRGFRPQCQEN